MPTSERIRQCIVWSCQSVREGNPEGRFWLNGYGLIALTRNEIIESFPANIAPTQFAEATRLAGPTGKAKIPEDFDALIRVLPLEFPGRVSICTPFGATRLPGMPPPLGETTL